MLRRNEVYARKGPSKDSRIVWTYRKASMPVQIISETRDWRLVCDVDGGIAWVSKTMLQNQKTVMAPNNGKKLALHGSPDAQSKIKAYIRPRSLAQLDKCKKSWCKITAGGVTGWVPQASLWGTQSQAVCRRPDMFATR
jgi:SH3-like domain-containing protein